MNKKFGNALMHETSPYLLQHAHNPVNWFPWGDEALELAKSKDLPILLSIGYSACHWCHVMEHESFEDEAVAQYMNEHFVNIKVDREERPDLDQFYMDSVQAMSGSGGWPLNVFLTTAGSPFYGGTYFPPVKAFNRSSWSEVLRSVSQLWQERRDEVESQAETLVDHIKKSNAFGAGLNLIPNNAEADFFNASNCKEMAESILKNADTSEGGFGKAPKFLQTFSMQYLLSYSFYSGDAAYREHVIFSLEKMLNGGIYDQLGGGISRYSTDDNWLVPHFEKMLYDNALFVNVLCEAYQLTSLKTFAVGIRETINFLLREMKHQDGGFFTALDADSEGVEGKFYVWSRKEIAEILGVDADIFCEYYNVTESGNWEETNILHKTWSQTELAGQNGITAAQFEHQMDLCRVKLLQQRDKRTRPGTDDKILLSSNALLITAFCQAYAALQDDMFKTEAVALFKFVEAKFKGDSEETMYLHTYKDGVAKVPAFLDDYSYLMQACIHLQEITSDQQYLHTAKAIASHVTKHHSDEDGVFFYYTHKGHKDVIIRKIEVHDGATPSANSIMVANLHYLGIVFDEQEWLIRSQTMLQAFSKIFLKYPASFAAWANSYQAISAGINEVVLAGQNIDAAVRDLLKYYIPNKVLQSNRAELPFPLLAGKDYDEDLTIYLCKAYACNPPAKNLDEIINSLNKPVFLDA